MDGGEVCCTASHPQWIEQKVAVYPLNILCELCFSAKKNYCKKNLRFLLLNLRDLRHNFCRLIIFLVAPRMTVDGPLAIVIAEGDDFKENLTLRANPPVSTWRWRKNGSYFEQIVGAITAKGRFLNHVKSF